MSYSFWCDGFGGGAGIVGTTLQVWLRCPNYCRRRTGRGFVGITDGVPGDLWIPADLRSRLTMVVGRKSGVNESAASGGLTMPS